MCVCVCVCVWLLTLLLQGGGKKLWLQSDKYSFVSASLCCWRSHFRLRLTEEREERKRRRRREEEKKRRRRRRGEEEEGRSAEGMTGERRETEEKK